MLLLTPLPALLLPPPLLPLPPPLLRVLLLLLLLLLLMQVCRSLCRQRVMHWCYCCVPTKHQVRRSVLPLVSN
jgi:hypothetical protein